MTTVAALVEAWNEPGKVDDLRRSLEPADVSEFSENGHGREFTDAGDRHQQLSVLVCARCFAHPVIFCSDHLFELLKQLHVLTEELLSSRALQLNLFQCVSC